MLVRLDSRLPLHLQVYRAFRAAILEGKMAPGSRLPSSRAQAQTLGVSRNVVLEAYAQLTAEGYLTGAQGSGTYVREDLPESMLAPDANVEQASATEAPGQPVRLSAFGRRVAALRSLEERLGRGHSIDFMYGLAGPDETTAGQWQRHLRKASESLSAGYGNPRGDPRLREALSAHLYRNRAVRCTPDDILIVSGSQQALSLASRVLFDPADRLLIEEPSYQGARQIFHSDGLSLVPVDTDAQGLSLGLSLETMGPSLHARGAYVTPSHQFPTGATMPLARRLALLEWAEREDAMILEDDYDSEYRYEGRPLEAIQSLDRSGRVLYMGTFSKVLFPSLRVGYLVIPPSLFPAFERAKWLADRQNAALEQAALASFLSSGQFHQHLRRMRVRHGARRAALLESLQEAFGDSIEIVGNNAGMHMLVWFETLSAAKLDLLIEKAAAEGVGLYSVAPYYLQPPQRAGMLFGYATVTESQIQEGIRVVARLIQRV